MAGPLILSPAWDGWLPAACSRPGKIPRSSARLPGPGSLKPEWPLQHPSSLPPRPPTATSAAISFKGPLLSPASPQLEQPQRESFPSGRGSEQRDSLSLVTSPVPGAVLGSLQMGSQCSRLPRGFDALQIGKRRLREASCLMSSTAVGLSSFTPCLPHSLITKVELQARQGWGLARGHARTIGLSVSRCVWSFWSTPPQCLRVESISGRIHVASDAPSLPRCQPSMPPRLREWEVLCRM